MPEPVRPQEVMRVIKEVIELATRTGRQDHYLNLSFNGIGSSLAPSEPGFPHPDGGDLRIWPSIYKVDSQDAFTYCVSLEIGLRDEDGLLQEGTDRQVYIELDEEGHLLEATETNGSDYQSNTELSEEFEGRTLDQEGALRLANFAARELMKHLRVIK